MKASKILLPLDGTDVALKAILPAKSLAVLLDAYIHIIHISNEILTHEDLLKKVKVNPKEMPEFVITHQSGDRAKIILEEGKSASYIVICNNKTEIINPVTLEVLENSNVPVLLVKPDTIIEKENEIWIPRKILMPLDGTPDSAQAFDASFEILRNAKAKIDVLHIFSLEGDKDEDLLSPPYYEDHPQQDWSSWSKEFLKRFCPCCLPDAEVKLHLSTHDPAEEILSFTEKNKNDLISIAWKGKLSSGHGEVLKKIIREIPCPILLNKIIPGKQYSHTCAVR